MWNEFRQVGRDYADAGEVGRYDETHADFRDVEAEAGAALGRLGLAPAARRLDIGCGTGTFAIVASRHCREVIGIDVSASMLSAARTKAARAGAGNVRFLHKGFLTYEHEGAPLDAVTTTFALHHLPDLWQAVALRRIHGMLAPGGRFLLRDVVVPDTGAPMVPVQAFIDAQARAGGEFLRQDAEGHFREEFSTFDWVIEGQLARAGFRILDRRVEAHVLTTYLCVKC